MFYLKKSVKNGGNITLYLPKKIHNVKNRKREISIVGNSIFILFLNITILGCIIFGVDT